MNRTQRLPTLLAAAALLFAAFLLVALLRDRLRAGDIFPPYSSLRADPRGSKALHDVLAEQPDLTVSRHLLPPDRLDVGPGDLVIVPNLNLEYLERDEELMGAFDAAVRRGARVLLMLPPDEDYATKAEAAAATGETARAERDKRRVEERDRLRREDRERREARRKADQKPREDTKTPAPKAPPAKDDEPAGTHLPTFLSPSHTWGLDTRRAELPAGAEKPAPVRPAVAVSAAPAGLQGPIFVSGSRRLECEATKPWKTWLELDGLPVLAALHRGKGELLVASDCYLLSNEALAVHRHGTLITSIVGESRRVVFYENHLGVADHQTLADLARSYGLGPALIALLIAAALVVWRQASPLVPPTPAPDTEKAPPVSGTATLGTLLSRSLPPSSLGTAAIDCAAEAPARVRPTDAALERMRRLAGDASWEKPPPSPLELHRRLASLARPPRSPKATPPKPST